jgi:hypothetical protein
MKNKYLIFGILIGALIVGLYYFSNFSPKQTKFSGLTRLDSSRLAATIYKTPNCNCCENYISYLKSNGFKVEKKEVSDEELTNLKKQIGLPENLWSCHTVLLNNYFIEGHIPIEAIEKLLTEKPEIDGIALLQMPSGSPGMPGFKLSPFKIHSVKNGQDQGIYIEI